MASFETKSVVPSSNHAETLQLCDEKYYHVVHDSSHIPKFEPSEWERQAENQQSQQFVQSVTVITDLAKHGVTGVAMFQEFNSFRHAMKKRSNICFKSSWTTETNFITKDVISN